MKKAKILVSAAVLALFLLSVSTAAFAADSIGYIEVTKVFNSYKETEKAQEKLKKEKEAFEKEKKEADEKLEKAQKDGKSASEIQTMSDELSKELQPKVKALFEMQEQFTSKIQGDIVASVKKVAKKLGIDIVMDKQALIIGGVDLTEMVVNDLNAGK